MSTGSAGRFLLVLAVFAATAVPLRAQSEGLGVMTQAISADPPTDQIVRDGVDRRVGPRADQGRAGVRAIVAHRGVDAPLPLAQPELARKRGGPQMIIGGVALVGGAIVGGDVGTIVMLAGLGYGLYGLYLYLQ